MRGPLVGDGLGGQRQHNSYEPMPVDRKEGVADPAMLGLVNLQNLLGTWLHPLCVGA